MSLCVAAQVQTVKRLKSRYILTSAHLEQWRDHLGLQRVQQAQPRSPCNSTWCSSSLRANSWMTAQIHAHRGGKGAAVDLP